MRNYEVAYISDADLDDQSQAELEEKVGGWISAAGGRVVETDRWGSRQLAYPIQKKNEGYYVFIHAELPPQAGSELERDMQLNESILRFMITLQLADS